MENRKILKEGAGLGLIAGLLFAIVEMLASAAMGAPAWMPLRMFASVVLGQDALTTTSLGTAVVVGTITHLVLAALFGFIYGLLCSGLSSESRTNTARQSALGLLFGTALWLVNFQIIARLAYPWFLDTNQVAQWLMHALAYGLPLGLMLAGSERRVLRVRPAATPRTV